MLRWRAEMTHKGTFMGTPATDKTVSVAGITIFRIAEGKIVQGSDNWDQLGLLIQIGAIPDQYKSLGVIVVFLSYTCHSGGVVFATCCVIPCPSVLMNRWPLQQCERTDLAANLRRVS